VPIGGHKEVEPWLGNWHPLEIHLIKEVVIMQTLSVGDLVDIEGEHLYRVVATRLVNAELWVK